MEKKELRTTTSPLLIKKYTTLSGHPVQEVYVPGDLKNTSYEQDIADPGTYPFTRGIHKSMYRGKIWTMRQFAGFGSPEDTNQRYHYLLDQGQDGLSVAFDLPTLMGRDADDLVSDGEVGVCGVSISSLKDMEILFNGIDLEKVSVSMTINAPAAMVMAFYLCVAETQKADRNKLRGTIQADILKEYIAQKEWIYPPHPSMRILVDMMEYLNTEVPQWNPISVSGYHIREAGSTAAQELAFTLADGFAYIEAGIERGMDIDVFAPRLSFFFNSHIDFFEEIAKFRAARRIYAKRMKNKYGAKNPRSWMLRFHTQTAGCSLTAQQPENNIIRTAIEALAGVLGGTNSLHTNSMDETLALPSEKAVTIALRTQQIIAYETGVINTVDPLAGSYFIENLTNTMEQDAELYFQKIDALGGVIPAIEAGFFQKEIHASSYRYQHELEKKEKIIVGVNAFEDRQQPDIPLLKISQEVELRQRKRIGELRQSRNNHEVRSSLDGMLQAAKDGTNLMPHLIACSRSLVTLGEMCSELTKVFGTYEESTIF